MHDLTHRPNLSLQDTDRPHGIVVACEVSWDIFEHSTAFEGAPPNFAANAARLGRQIVQRAPASFYYGTLFAAAPQGWAALDRLVHALPAVTRFYDLNLRPGNYSGQLVIEMLELAGVVKPNEEELCIVRKFTRRPSEIESFCREGSKRFGWKAVCVTLCAHGCAMLCGKEYVEAAGLAVHKIAAFASRVGALVASRHGGIPAWTLKKVVEP